MRAEEEVARLFARLDASVARVLAGKPVSCSRGCAACCYQLVTIGIGEALWIADWVDRQPDARDWGRRLATDAAVQENAGLVDHFERHVPCTFLDLATNECRIYERRPSACRYHFVRTPPENCALGAADPHTERYDTGETARYLAELDGAIFAQNPRLGPPTLGLLPHLVLYALARGTKGGDRHYYAKRLARLRTPQEWMHARLHAPPEDQGIPVRLGTSPLIGGK